MTKKKHVGLKIMAREIESSVHRTGSQEGTMSYKIEPSRTELATTFRFTYNFSDKTSEETVYLDKEDSEFEEYSRNPGKEGMRLLDHNLGGLEVTSLYTRENPIKIKVSGAIRLEHYTSAEEKVKDKTASEIERIQSRAIGNITISRIRKMLNKKD